MLLKGLSNRSCGTLCTGLVLIRMIETAEHHDGPLVLQFYSRANLTRLLLPYLRRSTAPVGARVVSVHAPGYESSFALDDLGLVNRPSMGLFDWIAPAWLRWLMGCDMGWVMGRVSHSSIMTTLFFEKLVAREREAAAEGGAAQREKVRVAFLHVFPGLVKTDEFAKGDFPWLLKMFFVHVMLTLLTPIAVPADKVGKSIVAMAEDGRLPGVGPPAEPETAAIGSDGTVGSGVYTLNWDGERKINDKTMVALRKKGAVDLVWDHCLSIFDGEPQAQI
jgi:hypothetical protein